MSTIPRNNAAGGTSAPKAVSQPQGESVGFAVTKRSVNLVPLTNLTEVADRDSRLRKELMTLMVRESSSHAWDTMTD